ncbi:MAG: Hsp20/alpha crystallin family protein [Bacillota bacterium]|nr:Hsp20/alpha crystallin family protein [Bacillota bacterium]
MSYDPTFNFSAPQPGSYPENPGGQMHGQETPPRENPEPAGEPPTDPGAVPGYVPYFQPLGLTWQPRIDIFEDHENILIVVEIPGVRPEQLNVESAPSLLVIRGEIRQNEGQMVPRYRERNLGTFYRQIPLPPQLNLDQAQAFYENGLLEIKIPKGWPPQGQH